MTDSLTLSKAHHHDVIAFADYLGRLFQRPVDAVAFLVRATPEYRAWRSRVELCPKCGQYVALTQFDPSRNPPHVTLATHTNDQSVTGDNCTRSGSSVPWRGNENPALAPANRKQLVRGILSAPVDPMTGAL